MATQHVTDFDVEALRRGIEGRDAETLTSLFGDDAECILVDKANPPSRPLTRRGAAAIAEYNRDFTGPNKTHRLDKLVVAGDTVAYVDACEYDDGTRVLCMAFLELRDGRIARQVCVQAWDE